MTSARALQALAAATIHLPSLLLDDETTLKLNYYKAD